ncbi:MAG: hypothetical protein ACYDBJ_27550, partial [Aggregatilineales bacterium]
VVVNNRWSVVPNSVIVVMEMGFLLSRQHALSIPISLNLLHMGRQECRPNSRKINCGCRNRQPLPHNIFMGAIHAGPRRHKGMKMR